MNFVNILDHSKEELVRFLDRSAYLKARQKEGIADRLLIGKTVMTIFEKPSTRTRVSLEVAAASMGAHALTQEMKGGKRLGEREAIKDIARVLSRYVDIIAMRTYSHEAVEEMAEYSLVPVINALSDHSHPTQAMADVMTVKEHLGDVEGKKLVFVGDGNNVARSLASVAGRLGMRFALCCPEGYELDQEFIETMARECPQADFTMGCNREKILSDTDVIYTDVWASMGQEEETAKRKKDFEKFQVNAELVGMAPANAIIMHCLPAHRGEEITDDAMDSPRSVVFDQAENRMHFYRGLYAELLGL